VVGSVGKKNLANCDLVAETNLLGNLLSLLIIRKLFSIIRAINVISDAIEIGVDLEIMIETRGHMTKDGTQENVQEVEIGCPVVQFIGPTVRINN
jgi:hypothetical protein